MMDLMVYEKLEELYKSFLIIKKLPHYEDHICKVGDTDVTVATS